MRSSGSLAALAVPPSGKRKNRAARPGRASSGRWYEAEVMPEAIVSSRSLSFHCEMSAPLSASSHATHSSCAASTPVNASVASPGPYTVPLKLLTDTVAAGSVVLTATAANPKTNDILILCILLQIAIRLYDTIFRPALEAQSHRNVTAAT